MSEVIKISANNFIFNKNITIDLSQNLDFTRETDIDYFSQQALEENINPIIDVELKRFSPTNNNVLLTYSISGYTDYVPNIFLASDILTNQPVFYNSLFILEYFDSAFKNTQNRLFVNYYRPERVLTNVNNTLTLDSTIQVPLNNIGINSVYLPNNTIPTLNSNNNLFLKIRFFNAKNGIIYNFKKNSNLANDETDYYLTLQIDPVNMNWTILDTQTTFTNYIKENDINQGNSAPVVITNNNSSKGTFINLEGQYQQ